MKIVEKGRGIILSSPFFFLLIFSFSTCLGPAEELEAGKLIEKVVSAADPTQSYALYLPSRFDPAMKWPVLFLFDPAARGPVAVEAFRNAAETFGWILVGSNNSRNGPLEASAQAAWIMWNESRERLPFDEERIYAGGFSGGARVASIFPRIIEQAVAGFIACGAGLYASMKPEEIKPAFYFGLIGLADFNYGEMKALDASFDTAGVSHRLLVHEGGHDWPDPALCARAVGWLDAVSMIEEKKAKNDSEIDQIIGKELEEAKALEDSGRIYWAAALYEASISLLKGLWETAPLEEKAKALKGRKECRQFVKEEKARDKRALEIQSDFIKAFSIIQHSANCLQELPAILRNLNLKVLKQEAQKAKAVEDRSFASRLLFDLAFKGEATGRLYLEKKQMKTAAAFFELALEACEEGNRWEKYIRFDLACVAALSGEAKKALRHLAIAVDKGFSDAEALETAKALASIRETPEFREILARIK